MGNTKTARIRLGVMLVLLTVCAVGFFTVGGLGNVCGVGFDTIVMICPLGALLAMIAERTAIPMALLSVGAMLVICVVLGRVFCSWVCPVHFMVNRRGAHKRLRADLDATPAVGARAVKLDSRHAILAVALVSTALFGFPVFCAVCPVGLTFALVLLVMRLFAFGETTWSILAVAAVIVAEVVLLPNWCRHFCPLGALHSLASGLNRTFRPAVDAGTCVKTAEGRACDLCTKICPEGIDLHDAAAGATTLNDCSKCRACADVCPAHSITFPLLPGRAADKEA